MKELNKNNPFKTPQGYFEGFDNRLMNKLSEDETNIPEAEGFAVPKDYFESLHNKISDRIAEETKVVQLNYYKKFYYAAASIAAIVLIILGLNWNTSEAVTFDSLAESDIESYFESNEYDLSAYEIAEVIPLDELEINDMLTKRFNEENIVDYLDNNLDDFDELNLEDYE